MRRFGNTPKADLGRSFADAPKTHHVRFADHVWSIQAIVGLLG
jgi:hypothetical protein